ncbi:MAG: hypothetical protein HY903_02675 [Deltaproteobacteria bacterium]|nr:hypothetical protein [Deltaproteobacteria bacterium]
MLEPLGYIDKLCLAGTRAPWASNAPTWRLEVTGALDAGAVKTALGWLMRRYPLIRSRVVALGGTLDTGRRFAWDVDLHPDVDQAFSVLDLRGLERAAREVAEQARIDRFLDLGSGYPFALTLVQRDAARAALFVQQHHALADGRAFIGLLGDLVRYIDVASRGAPAPDLPAAPRLPELAVLAARGCSRLTAFLRGLGYSMFVGVRELLLPVAPLRCNVGGDYSGRHRTHFLTLPEARLALWRRAREALGVSTNDLLLGALAAALGRWSARQGVTPSRTRLFAIVDTRPRDRVLESFGNHLSSYLVGVDLRRPTSAVELARRIGRQTRFQARHGIAHDKLWVEAPLTLATPISWLRRFVFDAPRLVANHAFSNLVALTPPGPAGLWRGEGFAVEALRVTTPCTPPQGANTTLIRYGGELCFNFNYKDSVLEPALAADLAATFEEALSEAERGL